MVANIHGWLMDRIGSVINGFIYMFIFTQYGGTYEQQGLQQC